MGSKAGKTFQVFNQNGLPQWNEEEVNRFYEVDEDDDEYNVLGLIHSHSEDKE